MPEWLYDSHALSVRSTWYCQLIAKMLTQGCICISIGSALVDVHPEGNILAINKQYTAAIHCVIYIVW